MIKLDTIDLQLGKKNLLNSASLRVNPGEKRGIIGANGSGKTSLFKLLKGDIKEDAGTLNIPSGWKIAYMEQELHFADKTALEFVLDGDTELRQLEKQIEIEQENEDIAGEKLATLLADYEHIGGYEANTRAEKLLNGLGFKSKELQKKASAFSGGWRVRLSLAQALMCRSDLLLLDEPTNHLDIDASVWLEQWLQRYQGTLLLISHDRDFLDNVIDGIISFENQALISYTGNYSSFEIQKADRLAQQNAAAKKQVQRIAEIEDFVRRFKAKASKAKQAQSRVKELERMERIAPAHVDSPFTFRFQSDDDEPSTLLTLQHAEIGYTSSSTSTTILNKVNLNLAGSSRIGLLGANGAGKSSLIKTLAGDLRLIAGERSEHPKLKIGYFAQHQLEALDINASPLLHLQRIDPKATEQSLRDFLGSFGFNGDRSLEKIEHFSGGEKARLALAIVAYQKPNLLILDEPTNHLDLEMCHALTLAMQGYQGAVIVVSHDRHLLKNTVDEFLLVHDGKVEEFDGSLADYQQWLISDSKNTSSSDSDPQSAVGSESKVDKKQQRKSSAEQRKLLKPLQNEVKKLEGLMENLTNEIAKIETELGDPSLYEDQAERLNALIKSQGDQRQKLEQTEERWFLKSEELEQRLSKFE